MSPTAQQTIASQKRCRQLAICFVWPFVVVLSAFSISHAQETPQASSLPTEISSSEPSASKRSKQFVTVTYRNHMGVETTRSGRILTRAVDGGILLEEPNGYLTTIIPEAIIKEEPRSESFSYANADKLKSQIQSELGNQLRVHQTEHYLLYSQLPEEYTRWCGKLLEHLFKQFFRDWEKTDLELHEPQAPLVVFLFSERNDFNDYVQTEQLQETLPNQGFYSVRSNRVVLIDLADQIALPQIRKKKVSSDVYNKAMFNSSTIVHEATHQLCYNSGMLTRYADIPLWLSEGLALYYETPNRRSPTGWAGSGKMNNSRLLQFKEFAQTDRPHDSLSSLIRTNTRFEQSETALNAYAEAWLLTSFLLKKHKKDFINYLKLMGSKKQLIWETPNQRETDFESVFGANAPQFEKSFLNYAKRLRPRR